ncbi:hypothetical protein RDWZM_005278 [Blomia tropicalis]|uniref:Alpha-methylacyl-CoA racemase n=1 Tax=Blomia tropicalis TaxID=40697 RepID=A0A9Q0M535_BLOTA|nr:hypothetical protein BLOT_005754 [Blomia tropicalis]KAJ6219466.1 hypothetical protein RDWZM_005278 [Blomia tropicalis]
MALKGIKVLELVGLAPVPFCGQILRDFGAKVLRLDNVRNPIGPNLQMFSAGKDTIKLNLKSSSGVKIVHQLIAEQKTDVFLDPFRPGVLEKLDLGPEKLTSLNPELVYARISSYGQTGPMANFAGHDINFVALSGVLSRLGPKNGPPIAPINLLGDFASGSALCALGIVMALLERTNSGRGQVIDHSMTEGISYLSTFLWETMKQQELMWPNYPSRASNMLDSGAPWYRCYETSDGKYLAVGALETKFYNAFIKTIGFDDTDFPQYGVETWPECAKKIESIIASKTLNEWVQLFSKVDACVTPVLELEEASKSDIHKSRNSFCSKTGLPNPAPKLSRTPGQRGEPNSGGTITQVILSQLGYSNDQILKLIDDGVIDDPESDDDI